MPARDRWSFGLECFACGRTGRAEVSEGSYPFLKSCRFSVDHLTDSFRVRRLGQSSMRTEIECVHCRKLA